MPARKQKADHQEPEQLVRRVQAYLDRQTAWLRSAIERTEALCESIEDGDVESLCEQAVRDNQTLNTFSREQQILLVEWRAAKDVPDEWRAAVQAKARQAATLGRDLHQKRSAALERIREAAATNQAAQRLLRFGRSALEGYNTRVDDASFLDRQA